MKKQSLLIAVFAFVSVVCHAQSGRWTEEKANAWYAQQPWLVGANYIPSDAINELEIAERGRRRIIRHLAEARLPPGKTLDNFDFSVVHLNHDLYPA